MSEDLIRRSDAIKAVAEYISCDYATEEMAIESATLLIDTIPTIEPKRGEWVEWIDYEGEVFWKCSACGQVSEASVAGILYKFCPFCGARMKGADDETD